MTRILTVTLNPALDVATEVARVLPDIKLRCAPAQEDPGGGGLNVARAVVQLGGQAEALAALGGHAGARVAALLAARGIPLHDLGVARETRQSVVVTEMETGRQYRFILPGPDWTAADCATAAAAIRAACRPGDILVPSGSLPPGVPADYPLRLNADLAPRGVRMLLDTSGACLAAAAAGGGGAAPLWALRMDSHEAETLAGGALPTAQDTAAFARGLRERGAADWVLVARGAEGTVIVTGEGAWSCPAPQVPVVSRTGAGDSFVAGFVLALQRGAGPVPACAFGVAAASSAVMTPATALCERETTEALAGGIVPLRLA